MKFSLDNKKLKEALNLVASSVDHKHPILSYIFIESLDKNTLRFSATNTSITTQRICEATVTEEGSICVKAEKFYNIIKNLETEVDVKTDKNDWVKIKSGTYNGRVGAIAGDRFPELPEASNYNINIEAEDLASAIKSTAFAVTNEETRFSLYGIKLEIHGGLARMIATDGSRIAYIEKEVDGDLDTLLHKESLNYLTKLPKGNLEIGEEQNHLFFKTNELTVATRKITGSFPDYKSVINFDTPNSIQVPLETFKKILARAKQTATDRVSAIKFTVTKNHL